MGEVYLFAPGNSEKKIHKALNLHTDAVIIDLEDSVTSNEKEMARNLVYSLLKTDVTFRSKIYVRINSIKTQWFFEDLNMVNELKRVDGIMIPKSEDKTSISLAAELLNKNVEIIPLIESAAGVMNIRTILSSDQAVDRVAFGSVDFALDIGVDWSVEGTERAYAMSKLVLASRAAGVNPPIDAVFPIIDDRESFIKDTQKGKQTGFNGKMVIHPKQIDWVKEVYTPSKKQLEWSRKVIDVFESSAHSGAIDLEGKLIDRPVYLLAKRLIKSS
ncbi:HpcH/HpaI aldolase/citrate lyase family protein [Neobacillus niacini]|uniref:HpcH/HpaI aldolase/citrate lyase family protein n=1 Tax=Neobacillus niacini TaxID=86668 RepID=UPI00203D1917|nr:CoA ester lyase [Neobacillus niacini]MCM3690892.1 CoA ester lyase [Neobacillus niacini]